MTRSTRTYEIRRPRRCSLGSRRSRLRPRSRRSRRAGPRRSRAPVDDGRGWSRTWETRGSASNRTPNETGASLRAASDADRAGRVRASGPDWACSKGVTKWGWARSARTAPPPRTRSTGRSWNSSTRCSSSSCSAHPPRTSQPPTRARSERLNPAAPRTRPRARPARSRRSSARSQPHRDPGVPTRGAWTARPTPPSRVRPVRPSRPAETHPRARVEPPQSRRSARTLLRGRGRPRSFVAPHAGRRTRIAETARRIERSFRSRWSHPAGRRDRGWGARDCGCFPGSCRETHLGCGCGCGCGFECGSACAQRTTRYRRRP